MILAQQLSENEIRYIELSRYTSDMVTPILKTFYSKETRVSALMELGNISILSGSPYGKYSFDGNDEVHCCANIRDWGERKGKNIAKYTSLVELQKKEQHVFLYKDNRWYYLRNSEFISELPSVIPDKQTSSIKDLEFSTFDNNHLITKVYNHSIKSWKELQAQSEEAGKPIFVFRDKKLITTINHPLNN